MDILVEKSKANLEIARRLINKENNICVSRLYYSVYQKSLVLLNKLYTQAKHNGSFSNRFLKKVGYILSTSSQFGPHDKKIQALKLFIGKLLGGGLGNVYESKVSILQKIRETGDYINRHVEKDEIEKAFKIHQEIETIFKKIC